MFADSTPSAHSKTRTQLLLKYTMHFLPQSHSNSRSRDECFPKASAEHCKQGRMDTSSNWFQGIKTGLAAKQIRLVPVPALTRRQGYRAKMTQSHFILGGFVFFLSFSYILHSLAANFFVSGRLLPWPVTPSQGWKATYDKFFFSWPKETSKLFDSPFVQSKKALESLHCIRTKPQPHWLKV